jgi:transcriptional regulator with XRE-family HTH domain
VALAVCFRNAFSTELNFKVWIAQYMDMKADRPTLGRLLRDLRARNGWTLKEMSERTEIPVSTLSKVERDRLTLTYDKLLQVSEGLKIPLSELFADPTSAPPGADTAVTARRSIGYLTDAVRVTTKNYDYYYMCPELRRKRMIPVIGRIRAKSLAEFGQLVQHAGEEYIYVLEGAIAVHTSFYDPVILKVGESIYVDSTMGHAYVAEGCEEATVLAVCSSADESLMESLMSLHGEDSRTVRAKPAQPAARQGKSRKR